MDFTDEEIRNLKGGLGQAWKGSEQIETDTSSNSSSDFVDVPPYSPDDTRMAAIDALLSAECNAGVSKIAPSQIVPPERKRFLREILLKSLDEICETTIERQSSALLAEVFERAKGALETLSRDPPMKFLDYQEFKKYNESKGEEEDDLDTSGQTATNSSHVKESDEELGNSLYICRVGHTVGGHFMSKRSKHYEHVSEFHSEFRKRYLCDVCRHKNKKYEFSSPALIRAHYAQEHPEYSPQYSATRKRKPKEKDSAPPAKVKQLKKKF